MKIKLPYKFQLRNYQIEPWEAVLSPKFKRGILVIPRRNGKDLLCWNLLIRKAMEKRALYYYMGPFYNQIRQIIWYGQDNDGRLFLDYIPRSIIKNQTKLDMRIELKNGSQIKLVGSDNIDTIVGTNPYGIVFTEFSLHRPEAWEYLRPILAANNGWALFNGTPRGRNHQYHLHMYAQKDPNWYVQFLTRDDTNIPSLKAIEDDRKSGMPEELIQQEYYCSYEAGLVGSYFGDQLQALQQDNPSRYTNVPWEAELPVITAWDLGIDDMTVIWFIQELNREIRFINCYANHSKGLEHYVNYIHSMPYSYSYHIFPHDVRVRELGSGVARFTTLTKLGLNNMVIAPKLKVNEGINAIRNLLPRSWFDKTKCFEGFEALKAYRREYDRKLGVFRKMPVHDGNSHFADAIRMFAIGRRHQVDPDKLMPQAVGWDHNPLWARNNDRYTDPNNYNPFTRRVHYG